MIWPFTRRKSVGQAPVDTPVDTPPLSVADTLRPRPDLRDRRFANWSMDRRQRYLDAVYGTPQSLQKRGRA